MGTFKVSLKPNERIYVNGAVIRFDRRTSLEFLNDVQFLLESHILQPEQADTPLKRLYFTVQIQLMSPQDIEASRATFNRFLMDLLETFEDHFVRNELKTVDRLVKEERYHEAMKCLRALFPLERRLLNEQPPSFVFEVAEEERKVAVG